MNLQRREVALEFGAQTIKLAAHTRIARLRSQRAHGAIEFKQRVGLAMIEFGKIDGPVLLERRRFEIDEALDTLDGLGKGFAQSGLARLVSPVRLARSVSALYSLRNPALP